MKTATSSYTKVVTLLQSSSTVDAVLAAAILAALDAKAPAIMIKIVRPS